MVIITNVITVLAVIFTSNKKQIVVIFSKLEIGAAPELQITVIQLSKLS